MNVLIALGSITPNDDANTNIVKLIASQIKQNNKVFLLGTAFCECPKKEIIDGVAYYRILRLESAKSKALWQEWSALSGKSAKIKFITKHPCYFLRMLYRHVRSRFVDVRETEYIKKIKEIEKAEKIDRVIAVTSPFYVASAAQKAVSTAELVWYQLDPNQSNITAIYKNKTNLLQIEKELYESVKYAVVPRLVYEENMQNELSVYKEKMLPAEFPNVRKLSIVKADDDVCFDKSKINLVFVGVFYEDIRNPVPLFELITKTQNENIVLNIVGGGCEELVEEWAAKYPNKIIRHGYRSLEAAINAMQNADILVNVDNTAKNMLPSKVNDYISTGKPIVNLHPFEDSKTVEYFSKYPLHQNIFMGNVTEQSAKDLERFCESNKGESVAFEKIIENYKESTPEFVSVLLMK